MTHQEVQVCNKRPAVLQAPQRFSNALLVPRKMKISCRTQAAMQEEAHLLEVAEEEVKVEAEEEMVVVLEEKVDIAITTEMDQWKMTVRHLQDQTTRADVVVEVEEGGMIGREPQPEVVVEEEKAEVDEEKVAVVAVVAAAGVLVATMVANTVTLRAKIVILQIQVEGAAKGADVAVATLTNVVEAEEGAMQVKAGITTRDGEVKVVDGGAGGRSKLRWRQVNPKRYARPAVPLNTTLEQSNNQKPKQSSCLTVQCV